MTTYNNIESLTISLGTSFSYVCKFTGKTIIETYSVEGYDEDFKFFTMDSGASYDIEEILTMNIIKGNISIIEVEKIIKEKRYKYLKGCDKAQKAQKVINDFDCVYNPTKEDLNSFEAAKLTLKKLGYKMKRRKLIKA